MRWHYRDAGLLWLFVPACIAHVAEEWFAGFAQWISGIAGRPLPASAFFLINAVAVDQAPSAQVTRGVAVGLVLHALVFVVAFTSARLGG